MSTTGLLSWIWPPSRKWPTGHLRDVEQVCHQRTQLCKRRLGHGSAIGSDQPIGAHNRAEVSLSYGRFQQPPCCHDNLGWNPSMEITRDRNDMNRPGSGHQDCVCSHHHRRAQERWLAAYRIIEVDPDHITSPQARPPIGRLHPTTRARRHSRARPPKPTRYAAAVPLGRAVR